MNEGKRPVDTSEIEKSFWLFLSLHVTIVRAKQMFRISSAMTLMMPWKFPKILLVPR